MGKAMSTAAITEVIAIIKDEASHLHDFAQH
jgi:hypothetical protein